MSALGHISGGHFNAVTFGFFVTRRMEPRLAAAFWFFQLAGAVIAALLLSGCCRSRRPTPSTSARLRSAAASRPAQGW